MPKTVTWSSASRDSILAGNEYFITDSVNWAVERQTVFSQADLLAAALSVETSLCDPASDATGEACGQLQHTPG